MNRRILILVFLIFAAGTAGRADVLYVSGQGQFPTISSAVNAAKNGDEIVISPGSYTENIILNKSLTLIGDAGAEIVGPGQGSVITVDAERCVIRNLTVRHSGGDRGSAVGHFGGERTNGPP